MSSLVQIRRCSGKIQELPPSHAFVALKNSKNMNKVCKISFTDKNNEQHRCVVYEYGSDPVIDYTISDKFMKIYSHGTKLFFDALLDCDFEKNKKMEEMMIEKSIVDKKDLEMYKYSFIEAVNMKNVFTEDELYDFLMCDEQCVMSDE
jgi:hypothetical protein